MYNKTDIKFSHIAPIPHLNLTEQDVFHMTLGHLVQHELQNKAMNGSDTPTPYIDFYRQRKADYDCEILMDNSLFEIYQHGVNGGKLYTTQQMIDFGNAIDADILVMVDHGGQDWRLTRDTALEQGPIFKEAGFKTMYVPQSTIGDLDGYIESFRWAVTKGKDLVDLIGVSIIGVPNAMGDIEKGNKLQRFLARWKMMQILDDEGLLDIMLDNGQGIHFLGALDGWKGEIELMEQTGYDEYIYSWDTSQAVFHGLEGVAFDNSPTGLLDGKLAKEVDFFKAYADDSIAIKNVLTINKLTTQQVEKSWQSS